ncbi:MAG TPA: hypothetical protein VMT64_14745 [Candidatus Binataceae bacterium]|nr:hypothetical protein [Candidatus Binataceae bacterium]
MDLLEFARGAGLHWAMVVMVAGFFWRGVHFLIRRGKRELYWARKGFHIPRLRPHLDSYAMHAGLLIVLFGFAPHILFIRAILGVGWPSLPIGIVLAAAVISLAAMAAVLMHRMIAAEPSIFSVFDDYVTWAVVFIAMLTGLLAYPHLGGSSVIPPHASLLTAHLLAVEGLMMWLPFGKLIHVAFMPMLQIAEMIGNSIKKLNK